MELSTISTKRIYQSVIEQFIELIITDRLKPGEKLPAERKLTEMLSVSRSSIREAIKVMAIIGIVEVKQGGGTYVSDFNIIPFLNTISPLILRNKNVRQDLLEFREAMEIEACRIVAKKSSVEKMDNLKKAIDMMECALNQNDSELGLRGDFYFHREIYLLTENRIFIKAYESIEYVLENSIRQNRENIMKVYSDAEILLKQHREIYRAMAEKDGDRAARLMSEHLNVPTA